MGVALPESGRHLEVCERSGSKPSSFGGLLSLVTNDNKEVGNDDDEGMRQHYNC
jgi:hypothetical protein